MSGYTVGENESEGGEIDKKPKWSAKKIIKLAKEMGMTIFVHV